MALHHMHTQADGERVVSQGNLYSTKKKHMLGACGVWHSYSTVSDTDNHAHVMLMLQHSSRSPPSHDAKPPLPLACVLRSALGRYKQHTLARPQPQLQPSQVLHPAVCLDTSMHFVYCQACWWPSCTNSQVVLACPPQAGIWLAVLHSLSLGSKCHLSTGRRGLTCACCKTRKHTGHQAGN
jgi:hypothetical protein